MGKRIDELTGLDDREIEEPDSRGTTWGRFLEEIEALRGDPDFSWADDTLRGIGETVEQKRWVTEGQRKAIENIKAGKLRRKWPGSGSGRRYEGWRR